MQNANKTRENRDNVAAELIKRGFMVGIPESSQSNILLVSSKNSLLSYKVKTKFAEKPNNGFLFSDKDIKSVDDRYIYVCVDRSTPNHKYYVVSSKEAQKLCWDSIVKFTAEKGYRYTGKICKVLLSEEQLNNFNIFNN